MATYWRDGTSHANPRFFYTDIKEDLEETIAARKEDGLLVTVDHFHVLVAVV